MVAHPDFKAKLHKVNMLNQMVMVPEHELYEEVKSLEKVESFVEKASSKHFEGYSESPKLDT